MNNVVYDSFPEWFLIAESVSLAVLLAIVVVSFGVYVVEVQILYTSKNTTFKGPFYRLMFIGILVDMTSAINLFVLQIIPARGWLSSFYFTNESWLGAIFYAITYGGRCVQGATAAILSFCRLSYAKYTYTMQAIQLSGAVASVFLLLPREYKYVNENGGYYSAFVNNEFRKPFYNFVAALEVIFVLSIVVNNLITYVTYRFKLKKVS
uniref:Serpentine receptor class gamma n=1 Tax=Caenorhabditis tropicalis TaxID=1561998 RepID=A0A1I7UVI8_9PELO